MLSKADAQYGSPSLRLPGLAANERLGMALEIVGQHAHRARRAAHLLQRVAELGSEHGIGLDELVGVVERDAAAVERAASAGQRPVELGHRLLEIIAERLERQLVNLLDDADHARLDRCELTRNRRQLHRLLRPNDRYW